MSHKPNTLLTQIRQRRTEGQRSYKKWGNISTWECNIFSGWYTDIYIRVSIITIGITTHQSVSIGESMVFVIENEQEYDILFVAFLSTQATKQHLIWQRRIGCSKAGCSWWCWPGRLWEGRPPARWSPRCRTIFSAQFFRPRKLFDLTFHHRQFSSWRLVLPWC